MIKYISLLSLIISCYACSSDPSCEQEYDIPFDVQEGQEYCFSDGSTLTIKEFSVSYCPCDADCIWEGETAIIASWRDNEGNVSDISIHEVLLDQNPSWAKIHSVSVSKDCEPMLEKVSIIINKKSLTEECTQIVQVDKDLYENGPEDFITIVNTTINGDCLTVRYAASGCSGNNWKVNMYDSGAIAESSPEQRYIRLSLENLESCLAVFEKEISFDLSPLRIEGNGGVVLLNLTNNDKQIRYEY